MKVKELIAKLQENISSVVYFLFGFFIMLLIPFIIGMIQGNELGKKKCELPKYQSYFEIIHVPVYYSFWLGCELTKPRFNLND